MRSCVCSLLAGLLLMLPSVAPAQYIMLEQFDTYCADPPCNDAIGDDSPDQAAFLAVWPGDGCDDGTISGSSPSSVPFSLFQPKDGATDRFVGARNRHDFTEAELLNAAVAEDPNPNFVKGTDANPLRVYFRMDLDNIGWSRNNRFVELTCGGDRAPTDTILLDPALCSGKTRRILDPAGDGTMHGSIAIGQIAMIDPDLCSSWEQHQVTRLAVYDGLNWHYLKNYPTPGTEMRTCKRWNTVDMLVKTNTIDITITSRYNSSTGQCDGQFTKTVTIPRAYTGVFSSIVIGGIPNADDPLGGCWDGSDNDLALGGTIPSSNYQTYVDDVLVEGGVSYYDPDLQCLPPPGFACCSTTGFGEGTCDDLTDEECALAGGTWIDGATCASSPCDFCPDPAADTDLDGDVDARDFALFQLCFTGLDTYATGSPCACFDVDSDGNVDEDDWTVFEACASGPGIPSPCVAP